MLILLFGYGLSLDVKNVPVAVVLEDPSPDCGRAGGRLSAVALFRCPVRDVDAGGRGADARAASGRHRPHPLGLRPATWRWATPRCRSSSTARMPTGPHHPGLRRRGGRPVGGAASRGGPRRRGRAGRSLQDRLWFNEANDSHYFLVPGLIVLVMTLIGAMLDRPGDGPRMGARHAGGAVRHAGPSRRNPARQDHSLLRAGHDRAGAVPPVPPSSCSTFRFAARCGCWPVRRCSTCWWRWASAC